MRKGGLMDIRRWRMGAGRSGTVAVAAVTGTNGGCCVVVVAYSAASIAAATGRYCTAGMRDRIRRQ